MKVVHNEMAVPMAATFLSRKRIGSDLYYDESLKTCPDYDFWLRMGSKYDASQFVLVSEPILTARGDRTSMSFRSESFPQFTKDKLFVLDRYLRTLGDGQNVEALRATASAGILTWAAEQTFWLEGVSQAFLRWCREAARFEPHSVRLSELARRSEAFEISPSGLFILKPPPQPDAPSGITQSIDQVLKLGETHAESWWTGANVELGTTVRITTVPGPWSYSALIPLASNHEWPLDLWCWVKLNLQVLSGEIGIGLFAADNIQNERTISPEHGRVDVFIRMNHPGATGVMVRNGLREGRALVEIFGATVECARKASFGEPGK